MAHSYLTVRNSFTERTICATDSILRIFLYFFGETVDRKKISIAKLEICNHYDLELAQVNASFIDLKLAEIHNSDELKTWYVDELLKVASSWDGYGEFIDNNYLNTISQIGKHYTRAIEINKLKNLINDLCWLLSKENSYPSDDFKWLEKIIR